MEATPGPAASPPAHHDHVSLPCGITTCRECKELTCICSALAERSHPSQPPGRQEMSNPLHGGYMHARLAANHDCLHSKSITANSWVATHASPGATLAGEPNLAFSTQQKLL